VALCFFRGNEAARMGEHRSEESIPVVSNPAGRYFPNDAPGAAPELEYRVTSGFDELQIQFDIVVNERCSKS